MNGLFVRFPNRYIHGIASALTLIGAIALDLSNVITPDQTWVGLLIAVINTVQGELAHRNSRPVKLSAPLPTVGNS